MTEAEWLATTDTRQMLGFVRGRPGLGRKRRLFAVAASRRVWEWIPDDCRPAVDLAERMADGQVPGAVWRAVNAAACAARDVEPDLRRAWAASCATMAVVRSANFELPDPREDIPAEDIAAVVAEMASQPAACVGKRHDRRFDRKLFAADQRAVADLVRDIFGNPFRPVTIAPAWWQTPSVVSLARTVYDSRDFSAMPGLADALEETGCGHPDVLAHCRGDGPHVRGCWVVDLILGKN